MLQLACKHLTSSTVVKGSPAPGGEVFTQGLATQHASSSSAASRLGFPTLPVS